jgi:pimeloyl-ACP methyl ester carboxylesterase
MATLVSSGIPETADQEHRLVTLMVIAAWNAALGYATDELFTAAGMEQAAGLVGDLRGVAAPGDEPLFLADPATFPEWSAALEANTPGVPGAPDAVAPILILQGSVDSIVTVESSQLVADRYCSSGAPAELRIFDDDDHFSVFADHLAEIDDWISERLAGSPSAGC